MNSTNITSNFLEKIEKAARDFSLFDGAKKILVGLSGGADSTSLVLSLKMLSEKYSFELFALHVNHMIRADEADRDEAFARNLCKGLGIQFFCERVDVPLLSKQSGEGLELCARNVRYKAFEKICNENGIGCVATAHNACDNTETVLFNLIRGSGTRGLCGIPPKRTLCEGVTVIRPLIYAKRSEIEEFLSQTCQDYVTDSTNSHSEYTRNYLRNEIIPLIKKVNPALEESILRTARLHANDEEYLAEVAKSSVTDDIEKLKHLHESILSRVVMLLFGKVSDETLSELHVNSLCEKIYSYDGTKTHVSLPDGILAKLKDGRISFCKDKRNIPQKTECFDIDVDTSLSQTLFFEENPYALYITFDQNEDIPQTLENDKIIYKKYTTDYLYFDTIPPVLHIRNRKNGDKILSAKMHKSVKRLLSDSCFDEKDRYLVPFVCRDDTLILVPSVCVCDDCKSAGDRKEKVSVSLYIRQ